MIKRYLARVLYVGLLSLCAGCSVTDIALSIANGLARTGDYQATRSVNYGPQSDNYLDIYVPDSDLLSDDQAAFPVVVFFYGGCWGACSPLTKDSYEFVGQALAENRYITIVADYRRHPQVRFPAIIDDARQAVEWVKNNIEEYGGDANKIFLMGHSAGAQMAAMLTLNERYLSTETYSRIKGFIGLAGPYDFLPLTPGYQTTVFGPQDKYPDSQPINFVSGSEPPLKLMHGTDDNMVKDKNARSLSAMVRAKGGRVETNYYDGVTHAGILAALSIPLRGRSNITEDIVDFLNRHSVN